MNLRGYGMLSDRIKQMKEDHAAGGITGNSGQNEGIKRPYD
jgi:hypothetical protein